MSIINEALKRAERQKEKRVALKKSFAPISMKAPIGKSRKINQIIFFTIGLVATVGIFLSAILFNRPVLRTKKTEILSDRPTRKADLEEPLRSASESTKTPQDKSEKLKTMLTSITAGPEFHLRKSKLRLNGIVYDNRGPVALINNRMVKVGEIVEEAKVVAISNNVVTLIREDKVIILKIRD